MKGSSARYTQRGSSIGLRTQGWSAGSGDEQWRLRWLRQRMRLSQAELARRIGAAGKAVVSCSSASAVN